MESYETKIAQATNPNTRDILGAIALVVNGEGGTIYHHISGHQSLAQDASTLDPDSTAIFGSAGKIVTHIAALQLVDRGLIGLNDPISIHVPRLDQLSVIYPDPNPDSPGFTLRPQTSKMTLRHMLLHTSGIPGDTHPLIDAWRNGNSSEAPDDAPPMIKRFWQFLTPLLFQPGQGWHYGHSVHVLQLVIEVVSKQTFVDYVMEHVFHPLGMMSSSYVPRKDLTARLMQAVERNASGEIVPAPPGALSGLTCSISDFQALLTDLISPESKILKAESVNLLFEPALRPSSETLVALRADTENYEAHTGIPKGMKNPTVNYTMGGLFIEENMPVSPFTQGTVTWNGQPNVVWAMHKEKGLAILFVTQLIPVDDPKTVALLLEFFKGAFVESGYM